MPFIDWIGVFGGFLTTGSLVPQIIRVFKLKSAREISLIYTTAQLIGILTWLTYGIILRLSPVIAWNIIAVILMLMLLSAKLRYGRSNNYT